MWGDDCDILSSAPPMCPFLLDNIVGMKVAIVVMDCLLDPACLRNMSSRAHKTQLAITNISQAGVPGLQDFVGAYKRKTAWISMMVTNSFSSLISSLAFIYELAICVIWMNAHH
jgi:hypothetical protein